MTSTALSIIPSEFSIIPSSVADLKKGDIAIVPKWRWVDVLNQEVVRSGNGSFSYGDRCGIETGGTVSVIGEIDATDVLVRYMTPGNMEVFGTSAPSDIIFQISKVEFSQMTTEYEAKMKEEQEHRNRIAKILEAEKQ